MGIKGPLKVVYRKLMINERRHIIVIQRINQSLFMLSISDRYTEEEKISKTKGLEDLRSAFRERLQEIRELKRQIAST